MLFASWRNQATEVDQGHLITNSNLKTMVESSCQMEANTWRLGPEYVHLHLTAWRKFKKLWCAVTHDNNPVTHDNDKKVKVENRFLKKSVSRKRNGANIAVADAQDKSNMPIIISLGTQSALIQGPWSKVKGHGVFRQACKESFVQLSWVSRFSKYFPKH